MSFITEYKKIYQEMSERNRRNILEKGLRYDPLIAHNNKDTRKGLGIFAFPRNDLGVNFSSILEKVTTNFGDQVIYTPFPPQSKLGGVLHFTLMQMVGVKDKVADHFVASVDRYADILKNVLFELGSFSINYSGLIVIPTGFLMYGYPSKHLNKYREKIRDLVGGCNLPFEEPYKTDIVHSTFVRFCNEDSVDKVVSFGRDFYSCDLGCFDIKELFLGFGSWRMQPREIQMLYKFDLVEKQITKLPTHYSIL